MVTKKKTAVKAEVKRVVEPDLAEEEKLGDLLRTPGIAHGFEGDAAGIFGAHETDSTDSIPIELRTARTAKGLSFSDLHKLTGLSRTTLHQYESGVRKPGARELIKLCEVLEVSPNRLLLGNEIPFTGQGEGLCLSLARMARSKPGVVLGLSVILVPLVAAAMSKVGGDTLFALATLADESLRARDPETFQTLSKLMVELEKFDFKALSHMSESEKEQAIATIQRRIGVNSA